VALVPVKVDEPVPGQADRPTQVRLFKTHVKRVEMNADRGMVGEVDQLAPVCRCRQQIVFVTIEDLDPNTNPGLRRVISQLAQTFGRPSDAAAAHIGREQLLAAAASDRARKQRRPHARAHVDAAPRVGQPVLPRRGRVRRKVPVRSEQADDRACQPLVRQRSAQKLLIDDRIVLKREFDNLGPQLPDQRNQCQVPVGAKRSIPNPEVEAEFHGRAAPLLLIPEPGGRLADQNVLQHLHRELEPLLGVDQRVLMLN